MSVYTELKVIVDNIQPYVIIEENGSQMDITGFIGELWSIMETNLHFRSNYIKAPFVIGKELLANKSADIILVPVVVTTTDIHNFDYSIPVTRSWYELYTKSKKDEAATSWSYLETWSTGVWIAFIFTIFLLTAAIWSMLIFRKRFGLDKTDKDSATYDSFLENWREFVFPAERKHETISFGLCLLKVLASVINRGAFRFNTNSVAMRVMMLMTAFFGVVMFNSYSAVLVSRLAVEKTEIPFPTLESIAKKNTHTICVREQSYGYLLFKEKENDLELMPEWRHIVNQPPCVNVARVEHIACAICQDNTIVLETPNIISTIMQSRTDCLVTKLPGKYATAYAYLLTRREFQPLKRINTLLYRLHAGGILDYLQKKWLSRRLPKRRSAADNKPVTMSHIKGVMLVYFAAILTSILTFIVQNINHRTSPYPNND